MAVQGAGFHFATLAALNSFLCEDDKTALGSVTQKGLMTYPGSLSYRPRTRIQGLALLMVSSHYTNDEGKVSMQWVLLEIRALL